MNLFLHYVKQPKSTLLITETTQAKETCLTGGEL